MQNLISRKKAVYPVSDYFREYLDRYDRLYPRAVRYEDLLRYNNQVPLYDERGEDTLWSTVLYPPYEQKELHDGLRYAYALLKGHGDFAIAEHLYIERVDLCHYANTLPFRVRIVNRLNENFDYFYVKRVDANRIYGLELEHVLSPTRINYFMVGETLIEEHVIGIPADAFMEESLPTGRFDQVRLGKEFVKFNERCFTRLLGDMHAGNYVIDITRDFEKWHYRLHPIDFDQQSHHGSRSVYLPQLFPQNAPLVQLCLERLPPKTVVQYQKEERALIANRLRVSAGRYGELITVMQEDLIAPPEHVRQLGAALTEHYEDDGFAKALTMGDLVARSMEVLLDQSRPAHTAFSAFAGEME